MAKYRKRPLIIEAFKWTAGEDQTDEPSWINDALRKGAGEVGAAWITRYRQPGDAEFKVQMGIRTLEGVITAEPGDYIIRGIEGEIYPCKASIFEKTYEAVPELRADIYSDPTCIFMYCPHPDECRAGGCLNVRQLTIHRLGDAP